MARRKKKDGSLRWVFLVLILTVLIGIVSLLFFFDRDQPDSRGCLAAAPGAITELSILIDATEPFKSTQLENVSSIVENKVAGLAPYDRVRIFTITQSFGRSLKPVFDLCKPDPDSVDSPIKKRFESLRFKREIENQLRNNSGIQPLSPIIFSLGSVASQFDSEQANREIVLISDLIQNSELLSMYSADWERRAGSEAVNKSRPMLKGIDIELLWLMRPNEDRQTKAVREWWIDYIRGSGGFVSSITPITGN